MIVQWFITVLLFQHAELACVKNKIELWDPVKCEAGKTFFAKLNSTSEVRKISQPYLYPWLAELRIALPGRIRTCTGALINDRYVLTAQDCTYPPIQPQQVTVHVGFFNGYGKDLSEMFQSRVLERQAAEFIPFPNYNPRNLQTVVNNLAIVKLKDPVTYSKTIYPIQLPAPGDQWKDYTNVVAEDVEWSYPINFDNVDQKWLKESSVRILDPRQCSSVDNVYSKIVTPGIICTENSRNSDTVCGEEHGGLLTLPRVFRTHNVTVLAAWEHITPQTCQTHAPPRIYVRIDNKLLWIKEKTKDGLYCKY